MKFSFIIPCFNSSLFLNRCVRSLKLSIDESSLLDWEIIIVDDGSIVPLIGPGVGEVIIRSDKNRGAPAARNFGVKQATGDFYIFIDCDVYLDPGHVESCVKIFREELSTSAITATYKPFHESGKFFSTYKNVYMNFHLNAFYEKPEFLLGAFIAIRKDFFQPFDETFGTAEDTDLAQKLMKKGGGIKLLIDSPVYHDKTYSFLSLTVNDFYTPYYFAKSFLNQKNDYRIHFSHASDSQLKSIALSGLILFSLAFLSVGLSISMILIFWLYNFKYYKFITEQRGGAFALKSAIWHLYDCMIMGFGILFGLIYFWGFPFSRSDKSSSIT